MSKKSWHTKNLSNQEKVWVAEQKKEAETNKTKELAKQIQQEREQDELDRISGKKTVMDRGIDWMYQGGTTGDLAKEDAERKAEEFLMGKEFVAQGSARGDFDDGEQDKGINNVVAQPAAAAPEPDDQPNPYEEASVKDRNESFRLRVEDPMFMVQQQQRDKEKKAERNKALYERVVGPTDNIEEDRKKSKKEKKRESKRSSRRDEDDRKSRRRSRSRSNERKHKHRRRERSRSKSDSRSRSDTRDHHADNDRHGSKRHIHHRDEDSHKRRDDEDRSRRRRNHDDKGHHSRRHHDSDDEDRSRKRRADDDKDRSARRHDHDDGDRNYKRCDSDHHHNHHHPDRRRDDDKDLKRDGDHRDHKRHHDDGDRVRHSGRAVDKREGYGLKGNATSSINHNDLGPNKDLLRKKREERDAERRRIRETASSRHRSTDQERQKALQEMQADARRREEVMHRHASHRKEHSDDEAPSSAKASFLHDMTQKTHGISGDGPSLSSRVAQNRHTNQRRHDSFL